MNRYNKLLNVLLILLLFCACTEPSGGKELLSQLPVAQKVKVVEKTLEMDSLRSPYGMTWIDGLLVFANLRNSHLLTAFDSRTGKYLGDYLHRGNGPNELVHITSLDSQGNQLLVYDGTIQRLVSYSRDGLLENNAWNSQTRMRGDSVEVYTVFSCSPLEDGCMLVSGVIKNNRFAVLDKNNNCMLTFGDYPGDEPSYLSNAFVYQSKIVYNDEKKIFAAGAFTGENIAFYDIKDINSPHVIKEYMGLFPSYKNTADGYGGIKKDCVVGVVSLASSPQYCIALYRGKPYEGREYGGDKLLLFDWETGKAVKTLQLDQVYENMTYDAQAQEVVLLGTDKETYDYRVATVSLAGM